jgi:preprotein translocase subunit SecB
MDKAAFSLERYRFDKVNIDFSKKKSNDLEMGFEPSGKFNSKESTFELKIIFNAFSEEAKNAFVKIECLALFKFEGKMSFEEIPSYFYRNSIAIIFPYIRAYISTVTLQANIPPIVLPTMNLSALETPLKHNTKKI